MASKIVGLLIIFGSVTLFGMEEVSPGKLEVGAPRIAAASAVPRGPSIFSRVFSRISPFSIDYERLARSLQPLFTDGFERGVHAMTRGLKEASSEFAHIFNDQLKEVMVVLEHSLQEGIGGAVEVGINHMTDALQEGGELQTQLNGFLKQTLLRNIFITGAISVGTVAGSTFSRYGIRTGWRLIERNLMRPKLIIASSKKTVLERIRQRLFWRRTGPAPSPEMICSKKLENRLRTVVEATKNIYAKTNAGATNVKYRNLMLWGPPGTGKTMFAKQLAHESGLEWAYMSGSSFAKFKDGEGIEEVDELFAWAQRSKGLLLFIDEAEAFLAQREQMDINSKAYQLLTNFLNHTGERSNKFMLVFATNHKHMIDSAMHRRIDDLIEMPLPEAPERFRVLALYRNKILFDFVQNGAIFVDDARICMDDAKLHEIAERTEGLSNGDLEGIINIIKTDADSTASGLITPELVDQAVYHALEKYAAFKTVGRSRALNWDN